jgi:hypothetical protein
MNRAQFNPQEVSQWIRQAATGRIDPAGMPTSFVLPDKLFGELVKAGVPEHQARAFLNSVGQQLLNEMALEGGQLTPEAVNRAMSAARQQVRDREALARKIAEELIPLDEGINVGQDALSIDSMAGDLAEETPPIHPVTEELPLREREQLEQMSESAYGTPLPEEVTADNALEFLAKDVDDDAIIAVHSEEYVWEPAVQDIVKTPYDEEITVGDAIEELKDYVSNETRAAIDRLVLDASDESMTARARGIARQQVMYFKAREEALINALIEKKIIPPMGAQAIDLPTTFAGSGEQFITGDVVQLRDPVVTRATGKVLEVKQLDDGKWYAKVNFGRFVSEDNQKWVPYSNLVLSEGTSYRYGQKVQGLAGDINGEIGSIIKHNGSDVTVSFGNRTVTTDVRNITSNINEALVPKPSAILDDVRSGRQATRVTKFEDGSTVNTRFLKRDNRWVTEVRAREDGEAIQTILHPSKGADDFSLDEIKAVHERIVQQMEDTWKAAHVTIQDYQLHPLYQDMVSQYVPDPAAKKAVEMIEAGVDAREGQIEAIDYLREEARYQRQAGNEAGASALQDHADMMEMNLLDVEVPPEVTPSVVATSTQIESEIPQELPLNPNYGPGKETWDIVGGPNAGRTGKLIGWREIDGQIMWYVEFDDFIPFEAGDYAQWRQWVPDEQIRGTRQFARERASLSTAANERYTHLRTLNEEIASPEMAMEEFIRQPASVRSKVDPQLEGDLAEAVQTAKRDLREYEAWEKQFLTEKNSPTGRMSPAGRISVGEI